MSRNSSYRECFCLALCMCFSSLLHSSIISRKPKAYVTLRTCGMSIARWASLFQLNLNTSDLTCRRLGFPPAYPVPSIHPPTKIWSIPADLKQGDLSLPTIWSAAEPCPGIVSACLPTLRPLTSMLWKSLGGRSGSDSPNQNPNGQVPTKENRFLQMYESVKRKPDTDRRLMGKWSATDDSVLKSQSLVGWKWSETGTATQTEAMSSVSQNSTAHE